MKLIELPGDVPSSHPRLPLSIWLANLKIKIVSRQIRLLGQVIRIEKILPVAAEAKAVDFYPFRQVQLNPWLFLRILIHSSAPCHGPKLSIVHTVDGISPLVALGRKSADRSTPSPVGEIDLSLRRSKDLQFINGHIGILETDTDSVGLCNSQMPLPVGSPVFFPPASLPEEFPSLRDLGPNLLSPLPARVLRIKFRKAAPKFDILEYRRHRVVVRNRDGIELMVMTTGAPDRHPHD